MSDRQRVLSFDLDGSVSRALFSSRDRDASEDELSALSVGPFEVYIGEVIGSHAGS